MVQLNYVVSKTKNYKNHLNGKFANEKVLGNVTIQRTIFKVIKG